MEKVSFIKAAQQLGVSVEDVHKMIKDKKLKEVSKGKVSKDAVYALTGLSPTGNQTKSPAGRKPNVITLEAASDFLGVDMTCLKKIIEDGEIDIVEGAGGVRGAKESMVKMFKKKVEGREVATQTTEEKDTETKNEEEIYTHEVETPSLAKTDTEEDGRVEKLSHDDDVSQNRGKEKPNIDAKTTSDKTTGGTDKKTETVFSLDELMQKIFPGIQRLNPEEIEIGSPKLVDGEDRFSKSEVREVANVAYMKGKLAVYESMSEFKRREVKA